MTDSSISESNFASVKLSTPSSYLTQDFILVISATGLDSPRCFVEPHPSSSENTTALGITFVPRFNIPDVKGGMEYIFVVDRSGSMSGSPINLLKEALVVLLRGLPTNLTKFNIFSFGSKATSLWKSSKDYTQSSLDKATQHVDTMRADYGGTEIAGALKLVFESLPKKRKQPVSVFLLTDGGAWDVSACETLTHDAIQSPGAFVRVFTVGIGSGVSTETVESIARAGNGMSIYVQENEPMTGKLARLVRAARTPAIEDIQVSWPKGAAEEDFDIVENSKSEPTLVVPASDPPQSVNLFNEAGVGKEDIGPPPKPAVKPEDITPLAVQQAPLTIRRLFPGTRTQMFAIISSMQGPVPSSIRVSGKVATTGDIVELDVTVGKIMSTRTALIHTLAARALITDREDGKHAFPASISSKSELLSAYLEADIIRLGTTYGLTSRHTSYVAIDDRVTNEPLQSESDASEIVMEVPDREGGPFCGAGQEDFSRLSEAFRASFTPSAQMQAGYILPAQAAPGAAPVPKIKRSAKRRERVDHARMLSAPAPVSSTYTGMSLEARDILDGAPESPRSVKSKRVPSLFGLVGSAVASSFSSLKRRRTSSRSQPISGASAPSTIDSSTGNAPAAGISDVARFQQFDGHFVLTPQLLTAIGTSSERVKGKILGIQVGDDVVATVLVVVWMRSHAEEEAQNMIEKAEQWLKNNMNDAAVLEELKAKMMELM